MRKGKVMSRYLIPALGLAILSSVGSAAALGADTPFVSMKGRWVLNVKESHWSQGGLTGGFWDVYEDDGKTRKSLLVQNTANGRINVFWFDGPYGDQLVWCNDWYREGYKSTGPASFNVTWEAERGGKVIKGGPDECKYNATGTKLTCVEPAFTEVYDKVQ